MFTVKRVAAFAVMASAGLCADVLLMGETEYNVVKGASQNITEKISGTGSIKKTGEGTLVLKNGQNDFLAELQSNRVLLTGKEQNHSVPVQ